MPTFRTSHEGGHGSRATVPRHALAQRQVHSGVLLRAIPPDWSAPARLREALQPAGEGPR